jgi:hypothetical protein
VHDRQYVSSLALSVAGLVAVYGVLTAVPLWLGWAGAAALAATAGGLLAWFYWGPRSDAQPGGSADPRGQRDDD